MRSRTPPISSEFRGGGKFEHPKPPSVGHCCTQRPLINPHSKTSNGVIEEVDLITPHMLINTWKELEYRLDICQATTSAQIKMYGRA